MSIFSFCLPVMLNTMQVKHLEIFWGQPVSCSSSASCPLLTSANCNSFHSNVCCACQKSHTQPLTISLLCFLESPTLSTRGSCIASQGNPPVIRQLLLAAGAARPCLCRESAARARVPPVIRMNLTHMHPLLCNRTDILHCLVKQKTLQVVPTLDLW